MSHIAAITRATAFADLRRTELAASPASGTMSPDQAIAAIEAGLALHSAPHAQDRREIYRQGRTRLLDMAREGHAEGIDHVEAGLYPAALCFFGHHRMAQRAMVALRVAHAPALDPVAMVAQPVQQAQAKARQPAEPAETFAIGRFGTVVPSDPTKPLADDLVMLGRLIGTDHPRGRAEARGIVERAQADLVAMLAALKQAEPFMRSGDVDTRGGRIELSRLANIFGAAIRQAEGAPAMVPQPCQQQQAQHTPGPWFANITGTATVANVWAERDGADIHAAPIADCADFEERRPVAEAQANAVLIAAAPDMLAALESALDAWRDQFEPDDDAADSDLEISGADFVDWFTEWRETAAAAVAAAKARS